MHIDRSFTYAGPNRRSDTTVIEHKLVFTDDDINAFGELGPEAMHRWLSQLHPSLNVSNPGDTESPLHLLGTLYMRSCIDLQCAAGHQVAEAEVLDVIAPDTFQCWFEYEEPSAGKEASLLSRDAINLALKLVDQENGDAQSFDNEASALAQRIDHYLLQAADKAMPYDCKAIYDAAIEQGTPILRMDRPPFRFIEGDFRLRYNGLFSIGHGCKQQTVDGTFCVSRSKEVFALVRDRKTLFQHLEKQSVPMPNSELDNWSSGPARAGRLADRLGYPVFLRTAQRGNNPFSGIALPHREAVVQAAREALANNAQFLLQAAVPGSTFKLLVAGEQLIVCLAKSEDQENWHPVTGINPSTEALVIDLAKNFQVGMMLVTLVASTIDAAPLSGNMAIVDVELAPRLDELFPPADKHLKAAATAFINWVAPPSFNARVPIAAITGTNGKTTTCRMLEKIVAASGLNTGLACSDGTYIGGERTSELEEGTLLGHLTLLTNPSVEAAVLEATRGGAASIGLGFDRCDVAVCLNVTADHLNDKIETDSVEALAEVKQSIVQRATRAVVLNADNEYCVGMIPYLTGRIIGLVSMQKSVSELQSMENKVGSIAVLEPINDCPWVVIYSGKERFPVIAANEIPLAFGGAAEHNLMNAMHAALAGYFLDLSIDVLASGLRGLPATFSAAPGRLSFYRQLPFDVCMDFAHNPAGVKALCQFTDQLNVKNRRVICLSCANHNSEDFIRDTAAAATGHFDHYICKNFSSLFHRTIEEGPRLLRDGLIASGVPPEAITCLEMEEADAIDRILTLGREGDLVVIVSGKQRQDFWNKITAAGELASTTSEG